MFLRKLPASQQWAFLFGDAVVGMAPDNKRFFATRAEAVKRAKTLGLKVSTTGDVDSMSDEFTERRLKKMRGENPRRRKKRKARKNPAQYWYIHIQKYGTGPVMLYNGRSFSSPQNAKPVPFKTQNEAMYKARHLLGRHKILSQYKIWVSHQTYGAPTEKTRVNPRRKNPEAIDAAAKKLEDFTGREATHVERAPARSAEKTGLVIGELDQIGYQAAREGIDGGRTARYMHKFRKGSRPLLAVSTDGKQLHVVGGQYEFTEAGIEDR